AEEFVVLCSGQWASADCGTNTVNLVRRQHRLVLPGGLRRARLRSLQPDKDGQGEDRIPRQQDGKQCRS
ncbi:hypothetical protein DBR06_SOUSAS30410005, partial [Sousa chinensis]